MSGSLTASEIAARPLLQLHLEPGSPLEVSELTSALGALARRYAAFVEQDGMLGKGTDAKLLILSVSPGSIDIALLPDLREVAGLLATTIEPLKFVTEFAKSVKGLLEIFQKKHRLKTHLRPFETATMP